MILFASHPSFQEFLFGHGCPHKTLACETQSCGIGFVHNLVIRVFNNSLMHFKGGYTS